MKVAAAQIQALSGSDLLSELKRLRLVRPAAEIQHEVSVAGTGVPDLDRLCGGGLPRGQLSELILLSGGGAAVLQSVLGAAAARGEAAALVDPADAFDPHSAALAGVDLARLLWVRSRDRKEALRGAELILEAGGFGVVALDLRTLRGRISVLPRAAWMRLRQRAADAKAALLVLSGTGEVGTFAALSIEARCRRTRWRGNGQRWLAGLELSFTLLRRRT